MLLISLLIIVFYSTLCKGDYEVNKYISRMVVISLIYGIIINLTMLNIEGISSGLSIYSDYYKVTNLSKIIEILILVLGVLMLSVSCLNLIAGSHFVSVEVRTKEYGLLILFNIIGLILLIMTNDLISLFINIELQSYCLYLIAASPAKSYGSTRAGLMYFLLGSLASIFILLGSSFIYFMTGVTHFDALYSILSYDYYSHINIGYIFIVLGLMFKIGLAPLHNWAIWVYNSTPTYITLWLSIMPKVSILTLLFNIINGLSYGDLNIYVYYIMSISIVLSFIVGSIGGLGQLRIKTILGYSGVLNAGYLLLTVLINTQESFVAYLIYIYQYALTHVNIFLIILLLGNYLVDTRYKVNQSPFPFGKGDNKEELAMVSHYSGNTDNFINDENLYIWWSGKEKSEDLYLQDSYKGGKDTSGRLIISINSPVEHLTQFSNLMYINSYLAVALIISLFSFIGIPPLIGFYGKFLILISSLNSGFYFISILLIICSVISSYYYASIIKVVAFGINYKQSDSKAKDLNVSHSDNQVSKVHGLIQKDENTIEYEELLSEENKKTEEFKNAELPIWIYNIVSTLTFMILLSWTQIDILIEWAYILAVNSFCL